MSSLLPDGDTLAAFPGLGVVSTSAVEQDSPTKETAPLPETAGQPQEPQSVMLLKEHDAEKESEAVVLKEQQVIASMTDAESFPALPKVKPMVSAVKEKKANAASRNRETKQAAKEAAREAARELAALTKPVDARVSPTKPIPDLPTEVVPSTPSAKRQHPGKLDISAATEALKAEALASATQSAVDSMSKPETPLARIRESSVPPSAASISRTSTPAAVETPIKRTTQPRTIRLIATPKAETPPPTIPTLAGHALNRAPLVSSPNIRFPSRQPSVASITVPGTPASEKISDDASITTESISRAGSPLPSRVGSAPVRAKTKSQQKKDRQERAKLVEEETQPAQDLSTSADGIVQEPIMGRLKKTKKATATIGVATATATSTPGPTRPATPIAVPVRPKEVPIVESPVVRTPPPPTPPPKPVPKAVAKPVEQPKVEVKPQVIPEIEKKLPANLPAAVIAELQASGDLLTSALDFFKTVPGVNFRAEITAIDIANAAPPLPLLPEELAQLDAGNPVRRGGSDGRVASRVLITPSRKYLRGLVRELEDRYLELEKLIQASKPPMKYTPRQVSLVRSAEDLLRDMAAALMRPPPTTTMTIASSVGANSSAAVDNGTNANTAKPATYADDALAYLNQFILPPLPARSKNGELAAPPPIGSAIPRTYTTGDPTYSVSGVDVPTATSATNTHATPNPATVNAYTNIAANAASAAAAAAHAVGLNMNAANATATLNKADALLQSLGVDLLAGPAMKAALTNITANVTPAQGAAFASLAKSVGMLESVAATGLAQGTQGQHGWSQVVNAMAGMGVNLNAMAGLMGLGAEEAEAAMVASRRECEGLEKKMAGLVKRNKRIVTGATGQ